MYKLSLISTALVTKALALSSSNFVILDENLPKNNNAAKKQQPAKRGLAGLVAKPRGMADSTKRNKPQQVQGFMKSRRAENKDRKMSFHLLFRNPYKNQALHKQNKF